MNEFQTDVHMLYRSSCTSKHKYAGTKYGDHLYFDLQSIEGKVTINISISP